MLSVRKIFKSIDGEVNRWGQGRVCTFIRFSGCSLHCEYCDTKYAQDIDSGEKMLPENIINDVIDNECPNVTITGGEPLEQDRGDLTTLVGALLQLNFRVSIETNGTQMPIRGINHPNLSYVMDYKLPSAGYRAVNRMRLDNFLLLTENDYIKFVVRDEKDFNTASGVYHILKKLKARATFAFSPAFESSTLPVFDPAKLVVLLGADGMSDCIISLQIHKLIWPFIAVGEER